MVHHSADFQNKLGRDDLPKGKVIGESWELVDRPETQSVTLSGSSQRELIEANPEQVMGDRNNAGFFGNLGTWEVSRGALYREDLLGVANWLYLGADMVWRVWRVRVTIDGLSKE